MTLPATPFRKDHTLTGSIVPLLYDWQIVNKAHLLVTLINTSVTPNFEQTLVVDTDYTVSGVGNVLGGNITLNSAYTSGWKVAITSNVPYEQDTDFTNQNSVLPEEAESMADKIGRQVKQIVEVLSRCVKTTVGGGVQPDDLLEAINDAVTLSGTNAAQTSADVITTGNNATAAQAAQSAAESAAAGIKWRPSVRAATTAALPSVTYNNGASGVGATLTATANGAFPTVDGVAAALNNDYLIKNQVAGLQNGVYRLTQLGTGGTPFILTRRTDADTWLELVSQAVIIEEGTTLADQAYICTVNQGGTIGTTGVTWGIFSPPLVIASQAEAQAGSENTKAMSSLRVQQALDFNAITKTVFKDKICNGLTIANNGTDAVNDIDIAAGTCVSDDGTAIMTLSSLVTKRLDAAWAVGSGNGGLDTGSIANDVYHVWVIQRPDTGVTDVVFSASATAPTMPTNYTKKKRIASFIRAGATILGFQQYFDEFWLNTTVMDYSASAVGASAQTVTLPSVPDGIKVCAFLSAFVADNGAYPVFFNGDQTAEASSTTAKPLATLGASTSGTIFGQVDLWTNTSGQIKWQANGNTTVRLVTKGWRDPR